jgi:branched-chain amino acid transport system permease protein
MNPVARYWVPALFAALFAYPLLPVAEANRGEQFTILFVYALLALALNVVIGYTGLMHLGIAAYFGIGAYTVGVLTVPFFPFQQSFLVAAGAAALVSALVGVAATAPILRLRGDYFALVTLGFGLITLYAIRNLDAITEGTKGLNPIEAGPVPGVKENVDLSALKLHDDWGARWYKYPYLYFVLLGTLGVVMLLLRNVERSRLGRAWVALREDELAATCMGLNPARLKLAAVALGAGLAGLAGAFYALALRTTGNPQAYDFTLSMIMVCCVILGGLGNRSGVLLGTLLLMGFDRIATNLLDNWLQEEFDLGGAGAYTKVSGWKLIIFGSVLILMMRFRPEGLLPEERHARELHPSADEETGDRRQESGVRNQEAEGKKPESG